MNSIEMTTHSRAHDPRWDEFLQDAIDGSLAQRDRAALRRHMHVCERCRDTLAQLESLDESLRASLGRTSAPADFDRRLLRKIGAIQANRRTRSSRERRGFVLLWQRVHRAWQTLCKAASNSAVAAVTMLISASMFIAGTYSLELRAWTESVLGLRVPSLLILACGASALALWITRATARDSSRS